MGMLDGIRERYAGNCMEINVLINLFFGSWPLVKDEQNLFLRGIRFIPWLSLFGDLLHLLVFFYDILTKLDDFELLSELIIITICTIKAVNRLVIIVFFIERPVEIVRKLDTMFNDMNDEETIVFRRYKRYAQWFTVVFVFLSMCFGFIFTIEPMFESERRFPVHVQFPFLSNQLESPMYELLYALLTLGGVEIAGAIAFGDVFFISSLIYVACLFEILQYRLENARKYALGKTTRYENELSSIVVESYEYDKEPDLQSNVEFDRTSTTTSLQPVAGCGAERSSRKVLQHGRAESRSSYNFGDVQTKSGLGNTPQPEAVKGRGLPQQEAVKGRGLTQPEAVKGRGLPQPEAFKDRRLTQPEAVKGRRLTQSEAVKGRGLPQPEAVMTQSEKKRLDDAMNRHLVECVQFHKELLSYSSFLQGTLRYLLFFDMFVGALLLGIDLFQIASVPVFSSKFVVWISFLILHLVPSFCNFWFASNLTLMSGNVSDAVYFSDWIEASDSYKFKMKIIMARANNPVVISGASFLKLSMENFTSMVNSAYSYFNVVTTMDMKRK